MRHRPALAYAGLATFLCTPLAAQPVDEPPSRAQVGHAVIKLPSPALTGTLSVEQALNQRRSVLLPLGSQPWGGIVCVGRLALLLANQATLRSGIGEQALKADLV